MQRIFGLIGYPLGHSFSKRFFEKKFKEERILNTAYELFELSDISLLPELLRNHPAIKGLNVTIPHKQTVLPFLTGIDSRAERIDAVNVIKVTGEELTGFNTDYFGFKTSLEEWLQADVKGIKALVLGTGGASKAVQVALEDLSIPYQLVSRKENRGALTYDGINASPELLSDYRLIINTTPLGMSPSIGIAPELPYHLLPSDAYCYDLVYNPEVTLFMRKCEVAGAQTKNGLQMLHLQAEKSWELWNA